MAFLGAAGAESAVVVAFDQEAVPVWRGPPQLFGQEQVTRLRERGAMGASDLSLALTRAGEVLAGSGSKRVIVVTDGMATAGVREVDDLRGRVAGLRQKGVVRLDVLTTSSAVDAGTLEALSTADLEDGGSRIELRDETDLSGLALATVGPIDVAVPGSKWVWPRRVQGLLPGDSFLVYADLPEAATLEVRLSGGAKRVVRPRVSQAPRPLLERAWVGARIRRLERQSTEGEPDLREAFRQQAMKLSIEHRVLSPWTALLVLETEGDYRRYAIPRTALEDIMTVSADGVAVRQGRADFVLPTGSPAHAQRATEESRGSRSVARVSSTPTPAPMAAPMPAPMTGRKPSPRLVAALSRSARVTIAPGSESFDGGGVAESEPDEAEEKAPARRLRAKQARTLGKLRIGAGKSVGSCKKADIARIVRRRAHAIRACYERRLGVDPHLAGKLVVRWTVGANGRVSQASVASSSLGDSAVGSCVLRVVRRMAFQKPRDGVCTVQWPFVFQATTPGGPPSPSTPGAISLGARELSRIHAQAEASPALTGPIAAIQRDIDAGRLEQALAAARKWRDEAPTDVVSNVALGRALFALERHGAAARAWGSIVDLHPSRADMRRYAGNLLEQAGAAYRPLAIDAYRAAVEQRPDHPAGHHMLGIALALEGDHDEAMKALERGLGESHRTPNFPGVRNILQDALAVVARDAVARDPSLADELSKRLRAGGIGLPSGEWIQLVMTWETDANDVDLHVFDNRTDHAYHSTPQLRSGGALLADVTRGYGPESFAIGGPSAFPYHLWVNYYSRGAMGYGAGRVKVLRTAADGRLTAEDRPYLIMTDTAWVDLGQVGATRSAGP